MGTDNRNYNKQTKKNEEADADADVNNNSDELYPLSKIQTEWLEVAKIGSGLQNLGNTCFLNAVLQCFTYTPALANFFLNNEHHKHKNVGTGFNSLFEMGNLVKNVLVHSKNKHYAVPPAAFVKNIRALSKTFKKGRQEDSHEFARCLLDSMHKRCCLIGSSRSRSSSSTSDYMIGVNSNNNGNHNNNNNYYNNNNNGEKKFFKAIDPESKQAETTFIWQVFGGQLRSCVTCQSCGRESVKLDPCMDVSLECAKVKSLEQAFKLFTRVEVLDGDNKYRCEGCKKLSRAKKQFTVDKSPNVLQIQLKRFEFVPFGRGKLTHFIEYPTVLDLGSYLTSTNSATTTTTNSSSPPIFKKGRNRRQRNNDNNNNKKNTMLDDILGNGKFKDGGSSSSVYDLIGVLVHAGSSMNSGHYFSYVKGQNGIWYEMDDESVKSVSQKEVLRQQAYLLFYSLRNAPGTAAAPVIATQNFGPPLKNSGNVDKNRLIEVRDQMKRKLAEEEKEEEEEEGNISCDESDDRIDGDYVGDDETMVISARGKLGRRTGGRSRSYAKSFLKKAGSLVKTVGSKILTLKRSKSPENWMMMGRQKKSRRLAKMYDDDDDDDDAMIENDDDDVDAKTHMKSQAKRDKFNNTQAWDDDDDEDDDKENVVKHSNKMHHREKHQQQQQQQQKPSSNSDNNKKRSTREYDEIDEEYDKGKINKHLRRRAAQKMPERPTQQKKKSALLNAAFQRKQQGRNGRQ